MNTTGNLRQLAAWVGNATVVGDPDQSFARVHTDTRTIEPGDLFVALQGEQFDGNQFLVDAKNKGAVAAIASSGALLAGSALPGILVTDTKIALGALAKSWRQQMRVPLIAVTGSNGKTTVTQMVASILRAHEGERSLATQGNLNNDIGVPLTLLRLRDTHCIAVIELGMNHPGEIASLAQMAQPTVALVNNAQREHLEFMANVESVASENGKVIESLDSSGIAVLPLHDVFFPLWRALAKSGKCLSFGQDKDGVRADIGCAPPAWHNGAWQVLAHTPGGSVQFALQIAGSHNVTNALAAMACCAAAGVPLKAIREGLENFRAIKGRSLVHNVHIRNHALTLIDDSYNANPDSVRAGIEMLAGMRRSQLLVLGDMGEVGDQGLQFHAEIGAYAQSKGIDALYTLGTLCQASSGDFSGGRHFSDSESLCEAVLKNADQFASVLVKGSRFMRMERVVQHLLAHAQPRQELACS